MVKRIPNVTHVCGKTFSMARNLKRHIGAVHNGQKDHKCDSCGKAFNEAGYLKTHINSVYLGNKDHKCDSCAKVIFYSWKFEETH